MLSVGDLLASLKDSRCLRDIKKTVWACEFKDVET